jgi:hypothetical protein
VAPKLPALPGLVDVDGLKAALGGVLAGLLPPASPPAPPQQQADGVAVVEGKAEEVAVAAVVGEALAEYQEALDAEIQYVKDQLERLKLFPAEALPASQSGGPVREGSADADAAAAAEGEEEDEDEEKEEAALFAANAALAATRRALDPEAVQKALQQLLGEKASVAASSVKAEAEAGVRALLSETTKGVEEVRGKAAATVSWVKDSLRGLQRQAKAALPSSGRQPVASASAAPAPAPAPTPGSPSAVATEQEEQGQAAWVDDEESPGVALYPPGEIFWIRPLRATAGEAAGYEMRRVRDVHFFDGIVLSNSMFTDHLLSSSVIRALKELEKVGRK